MLYYRGETDDRAEHVMTFRRATPLPSMPHSYLAGHANSSKFISIAPIVKAGNNEITLVSAVHSIGGA